MKIQEQYEEEVRKIEAIGGGISTVYMTQVKDSQGGFAPFVHDKLQNGHNVSVYPLMHGHEAVVGIDINPSDGRFRVIKNEED